MNVDEIIKRVEELIAIGKSNVDLQQKLLFKLYDDLKLARGV